MVEVIIYSLALMCTNCEIHDKFYEYGNWNQRLVNLKRAVNAKRYLLSFLSCRGIS